MSFHLVKGSPAFSPNNMRLAILGGKIIESKPYERKPKKQKGQKKPKYIEKDKAEDMMKE